MLLLLVILSLGAHINGAMYLCGKPRPKGADMHVDLWCVPKDKVVDGYAFAEALPLEGRIDMDTSSPFCPLFNRFEASRRWTFSYDASKEGLFVRSERGDEYLLVCDLAGKVAISTARWFSYDDNRVYFSSVNKLNGSVLRVDEAFHLHHGKHGYVSIHPPIDGEPFYFHWEYYSKWIDMHIEAVSNRLWLIDEGQNMRLELPMNGTELVCEHKMLYSGVSGGIHWNTDLLFTWIPVISVIGIIGILCYWAVNSAFPLKPKQYGKRRIITDDMI